MSLSLAAWLWRAQLRAQPGRLLVASLAIAIGVGLALAIHLVNQSALAEFDSALSSINGEAQFRIEARSGHHDESVWPQIANHPAVAAASPVIESIHRVRRAVDATGADAASAGKSVRLRILGIDPLRAARLTPDLIATAREDASGEALFDSDAIFLSTRALALLDASPGEWLTVETGGGNVRLIIRGQLDRIASDVPLAVMDIGTMQWRLGWLGLLSRIDLRLKPGETAQGLLATQGFAMPAGMILSRPEDSRQRMSNLSRAYRVNLSLLALVALFTGAFIVHSTMSLIIAREQSRLALLVILGADRKLIGLVLTGIGAIPGIAGALIGCALGLAGASLILGLMGGDLGAGLLSIGSVRLSTDAGTLIGFALAGVATALAGTLAPARRLLAQPSARALRSGSVEDFLSPATGWMVPAALFGIGLALLALPPIAGLPLAAYASIALWLIAGIACLPNLISAFGKRLARSARRIGSLDIWLATHRVAATPGSNAAALGGIVAAIALASAMAIMVTSFRTSVEHWLDAVLPADLYGRIEPARPDAGIDAATQARIAALSGVARTEFMSTGKLLLDSARPPVTVLAREIDRNRPEDRLPLTGALSSAPRDMIPIWISEAIADLYGWRVGDTIRLPLERASGRNFHVSGVWRDYARQHGAIVIGRSDWQAITGEHPATDFSIWLEDRKAEDRVIEAVRGLLAPSASPEIRSAGDLRRLSLQIFDRSFAATWALEAVAILVALFGMAAAWVAEALSRRREFGMLLHLGVARQSIARQFSLEALTIVAPAVAWGIALGLAISGVLVYRVNPQSFHWTMDIDLPLPWLAAGALTMTVLAVAVAWACTGISRYRETLQSVREDW